MKGVKIFHIKKGFFSPLIKYLIHSKSTFFLFTPVTVLFKSKRKTKTQLKNLFIELNTFFFVKNEHKHKISLQGTLFAKVQQHPEIFF